MSSTTSTNAMPLERSLSQSYASSSYQSYTSSYVSGYSYISYGPYLKHDIATERELAVKDFAEHILRCDSWESLANSDKVQDMLEDPALKLLLREYSEPANEIDLLPRFAALANHILKKGSDKEADTIRFLTNFPTRISGSYTSRKPHIVIVHGSEEPPVHWLDVLGYVEFKLQADKDEQVTAAGSLSPYVQNDSGQSSSSSGRTSGSSNKRRRSEEWPDSTSKRRRRKASCIKAELRCGGHALEMFSHGGLRTHALGLCIDKHDLCLQYFDRSIFVSSIPFSFKDEPRKLIAILFILQALNEKQWGIMPGFDRSSSDDSQFTTLTLTNGWKLNILKILSQQCVLFGRGTVVIRTQPTDAPHSRQNRALAIKVSSPTFNRRSEKDILQLAYDKATGEFGRMLDHLPEICYCEDICLGLDSPQEVLPTIFNSDVYERRSLRVIAFRELRPIQELTTVEELSKVLRDIFNCYRWLYEEVRILHRDISLYNIMYYRKDGKVYGVLNDFDLATLIEDNSPLSKQRTGTKPFMAYELLMQDGVRHLYRHDLESLFYVTLILTSHFENGKEIEKPPLERWFSLDSRSLADEKRVFLMLPRRDSTPPLTPPYAAFEKWIDPMHRMFRKAILDDKPSDSETLGGNITFDNMAAIFDIDLSNNATAS